MNKLLVTIFIILTLSCKDNSKELLRDTLKSNPVHNLKSYDYDINSPLLDKVKPIPGFVLEYLEQWDGVDDYKNYELTDYELEIFKDCLELLPPNIIKQINDNLVNIYFVENFRGSGLTNYIVDENNELYCFMLFNPKVLKYSLSEIIALKERTCFNNDDGNYEINIDVSSKINGFLYILLHEFAHGLSLGDNRYPIIQPEVLYFEDGFRMGNTNFTNSIWINYGEINKSLRTNYIPDKITFYGFKNGPLINISDAVEVYKEISTLPFASIYSTSSWAEDFAEYVTLKYLRDYLGLNYIVNISHFGEVIYSYDYFENPLVSNRMTDEISKLLQK
jgi:hypothetical protein